VTRGATSGRPLFVFMVEVTGTCGRNLSIRRLGQRAISTVLPAARQRG
jgi:hypothetical protein